MRIDYYSFGIICVDGTKYSSDIILYPDGSINNSWWRQEGHNLHINDLDRTARMQPEIVVIGSGANNMMKIEKRTMDYLENICSRIIVDKTEKAVKIYNKLSPSHAVTGLFHLFC